MFLTCFDLNGNADDGADLLRDDLAQEPVLAVDLGVKLLGREGLEGQGRVVAGEGEERRHAGRVQPLHLPLPRFSAVRISGASAAAASVVVLPEPGTQIVVLYVFKFLLIGDQVPFNDLKEEEIKKVNVIRPF